jgi:transcriptional regulator with XRE-family HTH domain
MSRQKEILLRIGKRVRLIRTIKGMTQKHLAQRVGITQGYLSEIEAGRHNVSCTTLFHILRVLDITVVLFDGLSDHKVQRVMTNVNEIINILRIK